MAPGYNMAASTNGSVSGAVNCGTGGGGGTSYAAPIAVGAAALVRQYFMEGFYPTGAKTAGAGMTPTAALLKGMLINSAVSMTGTDNAGQGITPIPSNEQGWGRIRLDQALYFTGGARKLYVDDHRQGMPAGATTPFTYTVNAVEASQPLKVTLTYTDFPGMPDSPPTSPSVTSATTWTAARLVNDIDLTVTGPSGTYLGNVFTNGASSTGGARDTRNNVEQVLVAMPTAGTYTITVKPVNIVQGNQDFALVVTGAFQSVGAPPGGTDGGIDAALPDVTIPPMQDATVDQEASTPPDAPTADVTSRPDGSGGTGGAGGSSGSGGTGGGGTGGAAGRGGAAGSAGASGSGGASGGAPEGGVPDASRPDGSGGTGGSAMPPTTTGTTPPPPDDGGCDCSIPRRQDSPRAAMLGLGLGVALALRRRRR
jgi:MYXO-CTERM domain-containing protein